MSLRANLLLRLFLRLIRSTRNIGCPLLIDRPFCLAFLTVLLGKETYPIAEIISHMTRQDIQAVSLLRSGPNRPNPIRPGGPMHILVVVPLDFVKEDQVVLLILAAMVGMIIICRLVVSCVTTTDHAETSVGFIRDTKGRIDVRSVLF